MSKKRLITTVLWLSRLLFGVVFVFSGFVKAIDSLGSVYKFQDYFLAFNMEWLFPTALPLAVLMSSLEFVIGMAVLLGVKMRYTAWGGLLFMAFFTPLTLYIAIMDPVSDCGCFGDALIISNWATFYKNLFILAASVFIFNYRHQVKPLWSENKDWYVLALLFLLIVWLSVYCLRNLPVIDFRPWKVGNNIAQMMEPVQEEEAEFYFVYRNTTSGEEKEFDMDDLPSADEGWEFVDRRKNVIREYIEAPVDDFVIQDEEGFDLTEIYLGNPDYQFILVAYDLNNTHKGAFEDRIHSFASSAKADGWSFIVLTGSSLPDIQNFREELQADYPFYQADEVKLKTIIRSNPGMLLMKDWVVLDKWHHRNIPIYQEVKEKHMD